MDMAPISTGKRRRICFYFNAQRHQLLHGIATAVAMARLPGHAVFVVSPAQGHIDYARKLVGLLGGAPIRFVQPRSRLLSAGMRWRGSVVPPKRLALIVLARWLNGFDAIAVPERNSTTLKKIGVLRPKLIHIDHGAGDGAAGFDPRIRHFDFVLMAGRKHRERLMAEGLIKPGKYAVVGYPKFEAADAIRDDGWRPFSNGLPNILYNPHFCELGSWEQCGEQILEDFAAQDRYNLILAPHVRLLDRKEGRNRWSALLDRYEGHPHIHIDRGSDRLIDMTYTTLADLYLGDISSQVYEFLRVPRPCLFLNPQGVEWRANANYAHWHFGEVLDHGGRLMDAVDRAFVDHSRYLPAQQRGVAATFRAGGGAALAARTMAAYLAEAAPARAGLWSRLLDQITVTRPEYSRGSAAH